MYKNKSIKQMKKWQWSMVTKNTGSGVGDMAQVVEHILQTWNSEFKSTPPTHKRAQSLCSDSSSIAK
jgi:hypothetical protein